MGEKSFTSRHPLVAELGLLENSGSSSEEGP